MVSGIGIVFGPIPSFLGSAKCNWWGWIGGFMM